MHKASGSVLFFNVNNDTNSLPATSASYSFAVMLRSDTWVAANGGMELPFNTRTGRRLLYCYNPKQGRHAYLDLGTDIILTDDEACTALGLY